MWACGVDVDVDVDVALLGSGRTWENGGRSGSLRTRPSASLLPERRTLEASHLSCRTLLLSFIRLAWVKGEEDIVWSGEFALIETYF